MREVEAREPRGVERWNEGGWERVGSGHRLTGVGWFPLLFCSILMVFDTHKSVLVNPLLASNVSSGISSDFSRGNGEAPCLLCLCHSLCLRSVSFNSLTQDVGKEIRDLSSPPQSLELGKGFRDTSLPEP